MVRAGEAGYTAFFDLDHTILATSSGRVLFALTREQGLMDASMVARGMAMAALTRLGLMGVESAIARWTRWYAGVPEARIRAIALRAVEEMMDSVRAGAREAIARHRAAGAHTVILSASPSHVCVPMARRLRMTGALCSRLAVVDDRLTGSLDGAYCFAAEKLNRARRWCDERGQRLDDAWYYADSLNDVPVLEVVGHPVCVTPGKGLRAEALRRGWELADW